MKHLQSALARGVRSQTFTKDKLMRKSKKQHYTIEDDGNTILEHHFEEFRFIQPEPKKLSLLEQVEQAHPEWKVK